MVDAAAAPSLAPEARGPLAVAAGALVLLVGFRAGLVPGPGIAVDLVLALLGWWIGSRAAEGAAPRRLLAAAWRLLWPAVLAAAAVGAAWAVTATSSAQDRTVRGEGLAAVAGVANVHVLLNGPLEDRAHRLTTPLQHLWGASLVLQLLLVGIGLAAATRPRLRRAPEAIDLLVPVGLAGWLVATAAGAAAALIGTSGQALLVLPWFRAGALCLGLAFGAGQRAPGADRLVSVVQGASPLAGLLAFVALVAGAPSGTLWPWLSLATPLAAVVLVGLAVPWPAGRRARASGAAAPADPLVARLPWAALVAYWALQPAAIGLVRALAGGLADPVAALAGSLVAVPLAAAVAFLAASLSDEPAAVERRRVLGPPVAVAVLVLLLSATGAFHWSRPHLQPRSPAAGPR